MQTTDGTREGISRGVALIRAFLDEAEFDAEAYERSLRRPLEAALAALPADVSERFRAFVRETVEPLVFDQERVFAACRDKGHFEDGAFIVDRSDDYFLAFQAVVDEAADRLGAFERALAG